MGHQIVQQYRAAIGIHLQEAIFYCHLVKPISDHSDVVSTQAQRLG
jgi:hypothetical protein